MCSSLKSQLRNALRLAAPAILLACHAAAVNAAPCATEDFVTRVSGGGECLVIATFGQSNNQSNLPTSAVVNTTETASNSPAPGDPTNLVIWLHGDESDGEAPKSHIAPAQEAASRFASRQVVSVAIWRPGYPDPQGNMSGGDAHGRSDNYTKANMLIVGEAVARLKAHYHQPNTIMVGHSGGAATAAILLGMEPSLVNAAVLVSCPCDLRSWRAARKRPWPNSEDPMAYAARVAPPVSVIAISGTADTNTLPSLARNYLTVLDAHQVKTAFISVLGATHNSALQSPQVLDAVDTLLK
jgi:pimeloyl-ACP methyl ester carboxylesterase